MSSEAGGDRQFPMKEVEFVLLLASLMALQALAIDVMLPALAVMADELGVASSNDRQLVIGVFLVSSGAFALFSGPLADRFGRRPVVLACLAGYLVNFAAGCACEQLFGHAGGAHCSGGVFVWPDDPASGNPA